ncbi:uncharacterized protein LOC122093074 [Macadamia integrifolia]|uniref:uncharacterized protein LOC122093074 n=1 Tax=Macadamia integrifolia TaxID=60698 RepID=UPI001C52B929|nr:uncharacterized protein LOC122093074 [Macadamia integrifolia]
MATFAMNRRVRSSCRSPAKREEVFYRYLKPGALAQLRDSKINARSQRRDLQTQIHLYRVTSSSLALSTGTNIQPQIDGFPCFVGRTYGPRCPQRKKLVAAKSFYFLSSNPSSPVPDTRESLLDVLSTDLVVSH